MATSKKAAAKAAKEETKVETVKAETAEVPAKKAPAKKAPAKKAAPKKVAPKKPVAKETKVNFFVEYGGHQESVDEVVKNIKTILGKEVEELTVYLKPEERKAYFVADGEELVMDVYFC